MHPEFRVGYFTGYSQLCPATLSFHGLGRKWSVQPPLLFLQLPCEGARNSNQGAGQAALDAI